MTEQEIYEKAKKRIKAKKGFFIHFGVYAATSAFLFAVNYLTFSDSGIWWAFFPALAWGIGIVAHYISVFGVGIVSQFIASFGFDPPIEENWEEKELEKEIQKIKRQNQLESKNEGFASSEEKLELKELEKLRGNSEDEDFV